MLNWACLIVFTNAQTISALRDIYDIFDSQEQRVIIKRKDSIFFNILNKKKQKKSHVHIRHTILDHEAILTMFYFSRRP